MKSERSQERDRPRVDAADALSIPCIELDVCGDQRAMTVAEYDAEVQHHPRGERVLWARVVLPVEQLSTEAADPFSVRVTDPVAYDVQMRALIGL